MSASGRNDKAVTDAIKRVLEGDVQDYEIIYKLCDGPLRSFIGAHWGRLGPDFVDEVAIRTHERALWSLSQFDAERGQFSTWLNWLARSVAGQVRASWYGPRFTGFDEDLHARYVPTLPGPEELHDRQQRDAAVRQAYADLDEAGRLTMFYHDICGMSFAATATKLGWSVDRVRWQRSRAIRQMRRRLHFQHQIGP